MSTTWRCPDCGWAHTYDEPMTEVYCVACFQEGRGADHVCQRVTPPEVVLMPPSLAMAGDPRGKQATWTMQPVDTSDGQCSQCGVRHEPEMPHNLESLAYKYTFYAEHDRWPTWKDAMAHCTPEVQEAWIAALAEHGVEVER